MELSRIFFEKLKATGKPYHKIAWESGLTPNQLYRITAGIDRPSPFDKRIQKLCRFLSISVEEAFGMGTNGAQGGRNGR